MSPASRRSAANRPAAPKPPARAARRASPCSPWIERPAVTDLFNNPHRYGDLDAWRREAVELHARGPIHRIDQPGYQPFWAVIGHDAVLAIERRPDEFTNGPIPILGSDQQRSIRSAGGAEIRTLIHMDEPDHA